MLCVKLMVAIYYDGWVWVINKFALIFILFIQ